jgi:hypothetical protein
MGAQLGKLVVSSSTRDFEIRLNGALEVESLSLWELCEGNLEGGLPCWGPWEGSSTRDFQRWMKGLWDRTSLSEEALWRGLRGELLHWGPWKIC